MTVFGTELHIVTFFILAIEFTIYQDHQISLEKGT